MLMHNNLYDENDIVHYCQEPSMNTEERNHWKEGDQSRERGWWSCLTCIERDSKKRFC